MNNLFKKILLMGLISGALSSFVFAESSKNNDLLHRLSNGEISDYSNGVELLNKEQREKVVGGLYLKTDWKKFKNEANVCCGIDGYDLLGYYPILMDNREQQEMKVEIGGIRNWQNYSDFQWLTVVDPVYEVPVIKVEYKHRTGQWSTEVMAYNTRLNTQRRISQSTPIVRGIISELGKRAIDNLSKF